MTSISKGMLAPEITLPADDGTVFTLSSHRGSPAVLFFYPQDDTEGCTIENQEFSVLAEDFAALGAILVGISPDKIETHCAFRAKYDLAVPLLADPHLVATRAYGLWQHKTLYGRAYEGLVRTTIIVGADGIVVDAIKATRIKGHAEKVLEALTQHLKHV